MRRVREPSRVGAEVRPEARDAKCRSKGTEDCKICLSPEGVWERTPSERGEQRVQAQKRGGVYPTVGTAALIVPSRATWIHTLCEGGGA